MGMDLGNSDVLCYDVLQIMMVKMEATIVYLVNGDFQAQFVVGSFSV